MWDSPININHPQVITVITTMFGYNHPQSGFENRLESFGVQEKRGEASKQPMEPTSEGHQLSKLPWAPAGMQIR